MMGIIYAVIFIYGLIIGSFLNCLVWRLYKNETLGGRSYCPHCRHIIAWYDNIPLLSFIVLRGRCRHCQAKIYWQYPLVESITAILFLLIFMTDRLSPNFALLLVRDWLVMAAFVVVFVYDFRWQLVPMAVIWPMIAIVTILNLLLGYNWLALLFFAALGTLFFLVQYLLTNKKGIGEGDIWIGLLIGLIFPNYGKLLLIMLLSYGIGAIVSLILVSKRKKKWKSAIALGPFLALGAIITLIWGEQLIDWYLGLFL